LELERREGVWSVATAHQFDKKYLGNLPILWEKGETKEPLRAPEPTTRSGPVSPNLGPASPGQAGSERSVDTLTEPQRPASSITGEELPGEASTAG
jgi:hypothetical protein